MIATEVVSGLVLAGGRARRMAGRDKGLILLKGRPMIDWVLDRFEPQVVQVIISANRSRDVYQRFGHQVVADSNGDYQGPLAGLAAGLARTDTDWLASVPCDSPLLPPDLVQRLYDHAVNSRLRVAVAHDGQRLQPTFSLVHRDFRLDLAEYLAAGGRKIDGWLERHVWQSVDFSDCREMFLNVNTPQDLDAAAVWSELGR